MTSLRKALCIAWVAMNLLLSWKMMTLITVAHIATAAIAMTSLAAPFSEPPPYPRMEEWTFREELAKLTKDIEISRPAMPKGMYLLSEDNLKVSYDKKEGTVSVWLTLKAEGFTEKRGELYCLTSEIDKCLAFNRALLSRQSQ